jgi:hypothetical protein
MVPGKSKLNAFVECTSERTAGSVWDATGAVSPCSEGTAKTRGDVSKARDQLPKLRVAGSNPFRRSLEGH